MAAWADDLRHYYAEDLGDSQEVALSTATAASAVLRPGRYVARVRAVSGAAVLWLRLGVSGVVAATQAPSTPFAIGGTTTAAADQRKLNEVLTTFIVPGSRGKNVLAGILDAGTATLTITKISRDAA